MSRDLNGRRLRDVENERRLQDYVETAHERQHEKDEERLEKLEKIVNSAKEDNKRKHFIDSKIEERSQEVIAMVNESIDELPHANRKRKDALDEKIAKRQKVNNFGFDEDDVSENDSSDDENQVYPFVKPAKLSTKEKPKETVSETQTFDPIDLDSIESPDVLQFFNPEHIKADLIRRGLKSDGSDEERAIRLFLIRGVPESEIPKDLLVS